MNFLLFYFSMSFLCQLSRNNSKFHSVCSNKEKFSEEDCPLDLSYKRIVEDLEYLSESCVCFLCSCQKHKCCLHNKEESKSLPKSQSLNDFKRKV